MSIEKERGVFLIEIILVNLSGRILLEKAPTLLFVEYSELSANLFSAKLLTQFRLARAKRGRGKEFSKFLLDAVKIGVLKIE